MVKVELIDVRNHVLKGVCFKAEEGSTTFLLGPNGAGKTTTLRAIAGLVDYEGCVLFDGHSIDHLPPHRRGVGLVPQGQALFNHMTVEDNVAYGLRLRRLPRRVVEGRVLELAKQLGFKHLLHRYPATLSGGERQKVAIARALAVEPRVLLLDEPFNNLDRHSREGLKEVLRALVEELGVTVIAATHWASELDGLEGVAVLMRDGRVVASRPLREVLRAGP
ncbi:MAG: hypothetical protein DRJ69_06770 [Thermoprotei archaeon]|nr:MAG: hypothetical protein DRJ69_06770 [Thermoprotei archaeon]